MKTKLAKEFNGLVWRAPLGSAFEQLVEWIFPSRPGAFENGQCGFDIDATYDSPEWQAVFRSQRKRWMDDNCYFEDRI